LSCDQEFLLLVCLAGSVTGLLLLKRLFREDFSSRLGGGVLCIEKILLYLKLGPGPFAGLFPGNFHQDRICMVPLSLGGFRSEIGGLLRLDQNKLLALGFLHH